ncbi:hypothetical protein SH2C18_21250 [Clostridium sediminicola]|uniref:serine hydrolase n=1 Tax=Clostridium sediminicola TaxID=3114879 RepID=UPI0031F1CEF9
MKKKQIYRVFLITMCYIIIFGNIIFNSAYGREVYDKNLIEKILDNADDNLYNILINKDKYEVQVLYTRIKRDGLNRPCFTTHSYNVDSNQYFYPASSIKLSACALALEKLNNLNIEGLNKDTPLKVGKDRWSQKSQSKDIGTKDGLPTIANFIKKVLVVSDNNSYDRLYEFLGQQYYNETMWKKGYKDFLVLHRLGNPTSYNENKYTNSFRFYNNNNVIYDKPMVFNENSYINENLEGLNKGIGYYRNNKYIKSSKNFSKSNYISIECLQEVMKAIMFPDYIEENKKFNLSKDDFDFLKQYMCMVPSQCDNPRYNYKDSFVKYFIYGDSDKEIPDYIKIYNKIGSAYGYLIDNAYIVDEKHDVEFLLTSVIYCNENNIFNDNKYNYSNIGIPFLAKLGRAIYTYELNSRIQEIK